MVNISLRSLLISCALIVSECYADLTSDLNGHGFTVVVSGNANYASASAAYNRRFSFQPAAITYPNNAQDVSTILKIASQDGYKAVARSGGHSYIANGLGGANGIVIVDMSKMNQISVDPSSHVATIGTGNRLGDVAVALNNNGRALPHGTCPYVGIGGHSGYGGYGFTSRKWGLTLDTIQSLDVVLANGTIATLSSTSYPDLFWGFRGSSGSFGIVTAVHVNTFAAPSSATIFEYTWDLSAAQAATALSAFQDFTLSSTLPAEIGAEITLGKGSSQGRVFFELAGGWYAPQNQLSAVLSPFLSKLPSPGSSKLTPGSYINSVQYLGGLGRLSTTGQADTTDTFYAKSLMTPQASPMSSAALTAFFNYLGNQGFTANTNWFIQFEQYGGVNSAINAVSSTATAFARRSSLFTVQFYTSAANGAPPFPQQGFTLLDGMVNSIVNNSPSGWDYGAYANYIDDRLQNWQNLYYGANYPRLKGLKDQYDPKNIFSFPTSVEE